MGHSTVGFAGERLRISRRPALTPPTVREVPTAGGEKRAAPSFDQTWIAVGSATGLREPAIGIGSQPEAIHSSSTQGESTCVHS